jgi:hypothetical protein
LTTTATGTSPAGSYPITAAGAADPDYTITYVAGTLTIKPVSPPTSSVSPLPAVTTSVSFTVSWSGTLALGASSIVSYDIFVSDNGAAFTTFLQGTTQTSAVFTGQVGHQYSFASVAMDNLGNRQAGPISAQAVSTMLSTALTGSSLTITANAPQFTGSVATFTDLDKSGSAADYTATITWGDGTTSAGQVADTGNGNFAVSGSHTYITIGTYNISAQINDTSDGASLTLSGTATFSAPYGTPPVQLFGVAKALTTSAEYYNNVIFSAYQHYLGRDPDADGLAYWLGRMETGLTDEHLEAGFIGSAEYMANHGGSGQAWVIGMYHDLLGRAPDPSGLAYWLNKLQNGTDPGSIAFGFAASAEREGQRVLADYQKVLGPTPAQAEIDYWVDQFVNRGMTNEGVIAGFVGSAEYYQDHYNDATYWLYRAYQAILGRSPDSAGLTYWLSVLQIP